MWWGKVYRQGLTAGSGGTGKHPVHVLATAGMGFDQKPAGVEKQEAPLFGWGAMRDHAAPPPVHGAQGGFDAKYGAADCFGDLRDYGVAERFDDEGSGRSPAWTADRNARASHPGGKPIIHP